MARPKKQKVYDVTISGDYYAHTEDGKTVHKPYQETVKMNDNHKKEGFLFVFKNMVAPRLMRQKYPDYADHLYTHRIVSVVDPENPDAVPKDPTLMNGGQLIAFIEKNGLPVTIALYRDEDDLRQGVIECLADEEAFVEAQTKRMDLRGANIELANQLAELNSDMDGAGGIGQATKAASAIDPDKVPDADDVDLPETSKLVNDTTDKVTLDATSEKAKADVEEDDFDI